MSLRRPSATVEQIVADAWQRIDDALEGVAHNKVLAVQLLLDQLGRQADPDTSQQWQRFAASTLMSGFITRGVPG